MRTSALEVKTKLRWYLVWEEFQSIASFDKRKHVGHNHPLIVKCLSTTDLFINLNMRFLIHSCFCGMFIC